jgi:hypothetical protein
LCHSLTLLRPHRGLFRCEEGFSITLIPSPSLRSRRNPVEVVSGTAGFQVTASYAYSASFVGYYTVEGPTLRD